VKLMNAVKDDKNDIIVEVFRSRGILIGSPTVNMGITFAIAGIIEMIHGMKFKNKVFGAFGSSGWGGGAEKRIAERMTEAGWKQATEPFKLLWAPNNDGERACREYGKLFVQKC
ncbi:MAG: flavodoxin domain-containing protein, partial [Prevotella sp.]|nr:flavodoxin domain-containing protein [Prevotella sp.]